MSRTADLLRRLCLSALLGILATAAFADPADRIATPLRTPQVETPVETAGTGLAPEVAVKVHVDTRGRVSEVEVREIRPPSEFDGLFSQVTQETLSLWRYAPAIRDGVPVETDLEWTIRFPSRNTAEAGHEQVADHRFLVPSGQTKKDYWDRVLRMNEERRLELLRESGERAEKHLDAAHRRKQASARFVVYTDHADPQIAAKLAGNFEATYDVLEGLLSSVISPRHERFKILAFVYNSEQSYRALNGDVMNLEWASGFYHPTGMLALHLQMPTNEALLSLMLHEATHAYLDRHVIRRGVRFPRWLNEGFAEYVGNSTIKKGQLVPGRTTRSQIYSTGIGAQMGSSAPAFTLAEVKQAIKSDEALRVPELVSAEDDTFYGKKRRMFYSMSWLLVHYLRHGKPGWADKEFPEFMLYVAEGYPTAQVLESVYGISPDGMDAAFRDYVKSF